MIKCSGSPRPQRYPLTCRRFSLASCAAVLPEQESCRTYSACVSRLQQCIKSQALRDGQRIHDWILGSSLRGDTFLGNLVIQMYGTCGNVDEAMILFGKMPQRDVVSWNTILAANAQLGDLDFLQTIFGQMPQRGVISWNTMITSFAQSKDTQAKFPHTVAAIFHRMPGQDLVSWNTLLAAYARSGFARESLQILCRMDLEAVGIDEITFISVLDSISAASTNCDSRFLLDEFLGNPEAYSLVQSSCVVANALVAACAKSGYLADAWTVFCNASHRDITCWSSMLSAYALNGHELQSLTLFQCMLLSGLVPDETIVAILLSACSHAGLVESGVEFFRSLSQDFNEVEANLDHYSCLIDLLARAGMLEEAASVIQEMQFEASLLIWTSIMAGCIVHGDVTRALLAAEEIARTHPDSGVGPNLEKSLDKCPFV
ncbi:hypothetical protein SELMODRAFT_90686 [Selaginella moellendorffii]|uniref:Pentacotripeptide-repeat region of PRORP domain-containing protein n=1 Tax=Selaginella moellendorffii TaxID=88036 RepID=D8RCZ8_SELML|nr:hypothetical protein SELMODRAFT_90686 [Selaginella moellendorffii]